MFLMIFLIVIAGCSIQPVQQTESIYQVEPVYQEIIDPEFTPVATPNGAVNELGLRLNEGDVVVSTTSSGGYVVDSPTLGSGIVVWPVETPQWPFPEGSFNISPVGNQNWPSEFADYFTEYEFVCAYAPVGTPIRSPLLGTDATAVQFTSSPNGYWMIIYDRYTYIILAQKSPFTVMNWRGDRVHLLEDGIVGYSDSGCLQVAMFDKRTTPPTEPYRKWFVSMNVVESFAPTQAQVTGAVVKFGN